MASVVILIVALVSVDRAHTQIAAPEAPVVFELASAQGFGDRQNSVPWSMVWWNGKLYVGTGRSTQCVQSATLARYHPNDPLFVYPPTDREIECAPVPQDLPLRAEIWCWTPETDTWISVFQSPEDVPIPGFNGKHVARDIGFRTMAIFREADGTEALYAGGMSSRSFNPGVPPPRILRTADGVNWQAIPQDPGTFLGDTIANGFRSMTVHNDRLYLVASDGLLGQGPVYEAIDPAGGNDNFRQVTPDCVAIYELASYNGFLYLGSGDKNQPFTVWKVATSANPPYVLRPVVSDGAYRELGQARAIVSMQVFKNHLYFGTDMPSEIYRINPDDSWDLIVGVARPLPSSGEQKRPLSGLGTGFDWIFNLHIWRMGADNDQLYVGTFDQSTIYRDNPDPFFQSTWFQSNIGFDIYRSYDGEHFSLISRNGLGDKYSVGVRQIVSSPCGLFIGSANQFYGLRLWRSTLQPLTTASPALEGRYKSYLALIRGKVLCPVSAHH